MRFIHVLAFASVVAVVFVSVGVVASAAGISRGIVALAFAVAVVVVGLCLLHVTVCWCVVLRWWLLFFLLLLFAVRVFGPAVAMHLVAGVAKNILGGYRVCFHCTFAVLLCA